MTATFNVAGPPEETRNPLKIGYALGLDKVSAEQMMYAKSIGVDYVEISFGSLIDGNRSSRISEKEMTALIRKAKKVVENSGIQVWSIHMPFGRHVDLSLTEELERQQVPCTGNCSGTARSCSLRFFSSTQAITWA